MKLIKGSDLFDGIRALGAIEDMAELAAQPVSLKIVVTGLSMRRHTVWVYRPSFRDKVKKSLLLLRLVWRGDSKAKSGSGK